MTDEPNFEFPEGFFNHLTPQHFIRDTSARHVAVMDESPFDEWVDRSLETLRFAFHAADGSLNPVAVLVGPDGRRLYAPDDDETLENYTGRLRREAQQHKSYGLFTAWLTEGSAYEGDEQHEIGSKEGLAAAGEMKPCLYWFAQYKDQIRHGIMAINDEGNTGDVFEAPSQHASPVYRSILGD